MCRVYSRDESRGGPYVLLCRKTGRGGERVPCAGHLPEVGCYGAERVRPATLVIHAAWPAALDLAERAAVLAALERHLSAFGPPPITHTAHDGMDALSIVLSPRYRRAADAIRVHIAELGLRELAQTSWLPQPELVSVRPRASGTPTRGPIYSLTFITPALLEADEARAAAVAIGADPDRLLIGEQTDPPTVAFWRDRGWPAAEYMRCIRACLDRGWQLYGQAAPPGDAPSVSERRRR